MTVVRTILGANFSNKKLAYRGADALLTGGTFNTLDIANAASNTGASSGVIGNIIDIAPGGSGLNKSGGLSYSGGGVTGAAGGDNDRYAYRNGVVDLASVNGHELLATVWLKVPAGNAQTSYALFRYGEAALGGSAGRVTSKNHISFESGASSPLDLRAYVAGKGDAALGGGYGFSVATLSRDTVEQVALHIQPNSVTGITTVSLYRNGTYMADVTIPYVAMAALTQARVAYGNDAGTDRTPPKGIIFYRSAIEDITASGRDPAYWVARDYALNAGRFS